MAWRSLRHGVHLGTKRKFSPVIKQLMITKQSLEYCHILLTKPWIISVPLGVLYNNQTTLPAASIVRFVRFRRWKPKPAISIFCQEYNYCITKLDVECNCTAMLCNKRHADNDEIKSSESNELQLAKVGQRSPGFLFIFAYHIAHKWKSIRNELRKILIGLFFAMLLS